MDRRTLLAAGAASTLIAGLTACAPPQAKKGAGADDGGVTTLNVWGWNQEESWAAGLTAFDKTQDEFRVAYRGIKSDEYNAALQTGLSGSSGPDLMMLRSYGGLETVVQSGAVLPVGEEVAGLAGFAPAVLAGATAQKDELIYGVPFAVQTANIIYNVDLFEQLGLDVPTSWDRFIEACDAIAAADLTPLAGGFQESWTLPILRDLFGASVYGGADFSQELIAGRTDFTDPRYAAANKVLLDLKPYFAKEAAGMTVVDAQTLFSSGKAAMYPGGIWELAGFRDAMADVRLGIFLAPPVEGSTSYAMGYVDGSWGVSARIDDGKRKGAFALLEYLTGKEYGSYMADTMLQLPCVPGVSPSDESLAQANTWFAEQPTPYITYVNFDYGTPSGTSLEYDSLQRMMLGQISPAQVGIDVDKGISQWFKPRT